MASLSSSSESLEVSKQASQSGGARWLASSCNCRSKSNLHGRTSFSHLPCSTCKDGTLGIETHWCAGVCALSSAARSGGFLQLVPRDHVRGFPLVPSFTTRYYRFPLNWRRLLINFLFVSLSRHLHTFKVSDPSSTRSETVPSRCCPRFFPNSSSPLWLFSRPLPSQALI